MFFIIFRFSSIFPSFHFSQHFSHVFSLCLFCPPFLCGLPKAIFHNTFESKIKQVLGLFSPFSVSRSPPFFHLFQLCFGVCFCLISFHLIFNFFSFSIFPFFFSLWCLHVFDRTSLSLFDYVNNSTPHHQLVFTARVMIRVDTAAQDC